MQCLLSHMLLEAPSKGAAHVLVAAEVLPLKACAGWSCTLRKAKLIAVGLLQQACSMEHTVRLTNYNLAPSAPGQSHSMEAKACSRLHMTPLSHAAHMSGFVCTWLLCRCC